MLNEIETTILALLMEGPRYGSEIEQMISERGLRDWLTVGSSSAYYVLGALDEQELLTTHTDHTGQRVYQLTEAGRGVLQTSIANLLVQPRLLGTGMELALANLKVLKPMQVYQAMKQRQVLLLQQFQVTEQLWENHQHDENGADEIGAFYSHGLMLMRAELNWLDEFLRDWRWRYPGVDPDSDERNATKISRGTAPLSQVKKVQRIPRPPRAE